MSAAASTEKGILLNNVAFTLLRTGEVDRALAQSRRSVAMIESIVGPRRPLLVSALVNAASVCLTARRYSEAEPLLNRALAIARELVGEEHLLTATVMGHYALLLKATHRKKEAAVLDNRVRAIRMGLGQSARQSVDVRELLRLQ
jgi:hypothetical protein